MTESLNHSPKLKEALAKMMAIAKEYDLGYVIALTDANFAEFKCDFPEWSLIQSQDNGIWLRLLSKEPELSSRSLSVLFSLKDMSGMMYEHLKLVTDRAAESINFDHVRRSDDRGIVDWKEPRI